MNPALTSVYLVGSLGKAVGHSRLDLDVKSVPEALRAINIITKGKLEAYLSGPARNRYYRVALQKRDNVIETTELTHRSGRSAIYIMPTIRGRNSGWAKVIIGIALIALTYGAAAGYLGAAAGNFVGAAALGGGGSLTLAGATIFGFGASMLLGGITQLLTPTPKGPQGSEDTTQSSTFAGNTSAVVQGGCISVVYGRALVAAVPVMISTSNNDVSVTAGGLGGRVDQTDLIGGGQQYRPGDDYPIGNLLPN